MNSPRSQSNSARASGTPSNAASSGSVVTATCEHASSAADFTYVWTACGFCYVSFITDVYSRRILGWPGVDEQNR